MTENQQNELVLYITSQMAAGVSKQELVRKLGLENNSSDFMSRFGWEPTIADLLQVIVNASVGLIVR